MPESFPVHWNGAPVDYGVSQLEDDLPLIAGDAELDVEQSRQAVVDSLLALPTLSIVMDNEDLFGPVNGLYANPFPRGRPSERPASVELILPEGEVFQVDAGLRMMGWTSRIPTVSPKHSLRLVFRSEYGPGRLDVPFFGEEGVASFNTISLRSNSRDAWISDYPFGRDEQHPFGSSRSAASYMRDQWSRVVQRDMGHASPDGNFVHLYLNGLYWGVYNPTERPDAAFATEHFGGSEADYDSVTFCNPTTRAADGDLRKWNELIARADAGLSSERAYQRIQGNRPDGTRDPELEVLLDVDSFVDYIIGAQFDAADDWPCNFYAIRDKTENSEGFQFFAWDNDLAFPTFVNAQGKLVADIRASRVDIDLDPNRGFLSSPWRIEQSLRENEEYLVRYADAVHRHLFNDGALSPSDNVARWMSIAEQVRPGLIAESARWGDYRRDVEYAGDAQLYSISDWQSFQDHMVDEFFPARSQFFVEELRRKGLYPMVDAPRPSSTNTAAESMPASRLTIEVDSNLTDNVWVTLDGSDPRLPGGEVTSARCIGLCGRNSAGQDLACESTRVARGTMERSDRSRISS